MRKSAEPKIKSWMEKFYGPKETPESRKADELETAFFERAYSQLDESAKLHISKRPDIIDVEELSITSEESNNDVVYHRLYRGCLKNYLMPTESYRNKWRIVEFKAVQDKHDPQSFLQQMPFHLEQVEEPLILSPEVIEKPTTSNSRYKSYCSSHNTFSFEAPIIKRSGRVTRFQRFLRPTTVSQMKSEHQRAKKSQLTETLEQRKKRLRIPQSRPESIIRPKSITRQSPSDRRSKLSQPIKIATPRLHSTFEYPEEDPYSPPDIQSLSFEDALPSLHRFVKLYSPLKKQKLKG
mmetsp:Transcript_32074/g.55342  ORF Transcript_32074/g.55342 Transcript_32074/m.55342 type:complete len:294 (-) Transcript_32074:1886-2767(-)